MSAYHDRERERRHAQAKANETGEPWVVWVQDGKYLSTAKRKWLTIAASGRHASARFVCECEPADQTLMEL